MSNAKTGTEDGLPRIIHEHLIPLLIPIQVISVMVDEDAFGDEAIRVFVVIDPEKVLPRVLGLARALRPILAEHGEERLPIFSFITPEDAKEELRAAA